jgi:hypothetical protein
VKNVAKWISQTKERDHQMKGKGRKTGRKKRGGLGLLSGKGQTLPERQKKFCGGDQKVHGRWPRVAAQDKENANLKDRPAI